MKHFSIPELGQLFMVGLPAVELDVGTRSLIRHFRINNFILFKRNVSGKEQLRQLCKALQLACRENGLPVPLISIDQEGGSVARLPAPFTQFADARMLAESAEPEKELVAYASTCARELKEVGITMNLAPVLDVCAAGDNYYMERRSLGQDPALVARFGRLIIEEMQRQGVAACAKHFPGLGAAVVDPHLELSRVVRTRQQLWDSDLRPFREAAEARVAAIMTSHTVYDTLDPGMPATLSKKILTDLLRLEMGYDGVIITDDLEMGAIEKEQPLAGAALKALQAGADLVLICHDQAKVIHACEMIVKAVEEGKLPAKGLQDSVKRLSAVRNRFCEG
jgi:beta-N-acetylhexosaminidase